LDGSREKGGVSPRDLHAGDLESSAEFYGFSPRRNHELSQQRKLPGPLIAQEEPGGLLA